MSENPSNKMDWKICFICQNKQATTGLRSTNDGWRKLAEQLLKFKEVGGVLRTDLDKIENVDELYSCLQENKAVYHKNCYNEHRDDKIQRLKKSLEKASSSSLTQVGSPQTRPKRSGEWNLGDLRCSICGDEDVLNNLHMAAEVKIQKSGVSPVDHLKQKTDEWKELAKTPGYETLYSMIVMGDLKSNEIFYHNKCWTKLKRDAQKFSSAQKSQEKNKTFDFKMNYCLRKIYHELYENLYIYIYSLSTLARQYSS